MPKGLRQKNQLRYDRIVFLYSEGMTSTEIMQEMEIPAPSYWRILRVGGGMPMWAKIDNLRHRGKLGGKGNRK